MLKLLLILPVAFFILASCQREIDGFTQSSGNATTTTETPKFKTIRLQSMDPTDLWDVTLAIQRDSVNRKLNIYRDAPATTNTLFDTLYFVYEFNAAGYLTKKFTRNENGQVIPQFIFNRDVSNRLLNVVEMDVFQGGQGDITRYFSYQTSGNTVIIQDSVPDFTFNDSRKAVRHFINQKLMSQQNYEAGNLIDNINYTYNSQGNLSSVKGLNDSTDIIYDNHTLSGWTGLTEFYMGADGYLLKEIKPIDELGYHFMTFLHLTMHEKPFNILFTPPIASITMRGFIDPQRSFYENKTVQYVNEYSSDHKLIKSTINAPGQDAFIISFGY